MTEPELIEREKQLLQSLAGLVDEQAQAVERTEARSSATAKAAEQEFAAARASLTARREAGLRQAQTGLEEARQQIQEQFATATAQYENEFQTSQEAVDAQRETDQAAAVKIADDARFETTALYEATKIGLTERLKQIEQQSASMTEAVWARRAELDRILDRFPRGLATSLRAGPLAESQSTAGNLAFDVSLAAADARLAELQAMVLPPLFRPGPLAAVLIACWLVLLYPAGWITGWRLSWIALDAAAVAGIGAALAALYRSVKLRVRAVYEPLDEALAAAKVARRGWKRAAVARHRSDWDANRARRRDATARAKRDCQSHLDETARHCDRLEREAQDRYARAEAETTHRRDLDQRLAEDQFNRRQAEIHERHETDWRQLHERYELQTAEHRGQVEEARRELADRWHQRVAAAIEEAREIRLAASRLLPEWHDSAWLDWTPPAAAPPALRFGEVEVESQQVAGELLPAMTIPALAPFPEQASLFIKAAGPAGRKAADALLEAAMLRLLTAIPPGKVRFTIIDPVGLGQNFAAFMHLADYDEALVGGRIWTETAHVEQKLADLAEQMETIIQKYLRNEFESLEDYNAQAGEMAEPLRVLVVADFPTNFSEQAARRLASIAASGRRCGVYTLVAHDASQRLPTGVKVADLEQHSVKLTWRGDRFTWDDPLFGPHRLTVDEAPAAEQFTRILRLVGQAAATARRVEVPFERIAPPADRWWTGDSREGINVLLGLSGARRQQRLKLGQGTAQHVLAAGKTGSGKSTLWHALITNLSLIYSPSEVELYLVDFKKGVEFKTYASHALPHVRVVAIESDREFGVSVLQRLDAELKTRGERFRARGVQDLAAYRRAADEPLPRVLLIVDEFQEFFVEDDKLAQEAALLLDRLVRQGRAFGIHVLLGSQTLGGAYSLAKSTIGQMAVRIALQSSEADAHLVLGEDNSAARLLSRPGEAIYNDAGGLIEANHPFQVAWLPDHQRDEYLARLADLAARDQREPAPPAIVFEGNVPADIRQNRLLDEWLRGPAWPEPVEPRLWLGEPVSIKAPTAAVLRRQSGHNLLLIGQHEQAATGVLAAALVSLAAQHPAGRNGAGNASEAGAATRFYLLDGSSTSGKSPGHEGPLARVAAALPHEVQPGGWRDVPRIVGELAAEVERRRQAEASEACPWYLVIHDLQRFRDLRRQDDDFGFSRTTEAVRPAQQLGTILREGPLVGVHTLVWCDSLANAQRTFDRQTLREFDQRVLFQMSASDSSSLIDTPAASRLGQHRAILHSEEQNLLEKFRPYAVAPDDWLAWAREQLLRRLAFPSSKTTRAVINHGVTKGTETDEETKTTAEIATDEAQRRC